MTMQSTIERKLAERFAPMHSEVVNESHLHNVPPGSESHFKLTVVSEHFEGSNLVARHGMVNELLTEELKGPIHALALSVLTPDEWFDRGGTLPDSPPCLGGSSADG